MPQTNRMNLRYPAGSDTPDVVRDLGYLAADIEAILPRLLGSERQAGIVNAGDLKVTAGAGMTVNVAAGVAMVPDQTDTYAALTPVFRAGLNGLAVTAANGSNPRIDQVLIDADGTLSVLAGVATAGATLDNRAGAAVPGNGLLRIADILIPAASASISAGNIRDRRPWSRGFFRYISRTAGDISRASSGFAYVDSTLLLPRCELSGVPIKVTFGAVHDHTLGGQCFTTLFIDGSQLGELAFATDIRAATAYQGATYDWDYIPSAGSHLLGPGFRSNASNGILYSNSTDACHFRIEEIIRPNADNS